MPGYATTPGGTLPLGTSVFNGVRQGTMATPATSRTVVPTAVVSPPVGGLLRVWTGSVWIDRPVKVWTGTAWVAKPVKFWNGSQWVLA